MREAGIWRGPQDGCAIGLGILPVGTINLGVAPHPTCKFSLLVTEGALDILPTEELQAAFAHEIGHVQLGHLSARQTRREAEQAARETKEAVEEGTAGAFVTATVSSGASADGQYRSYDREEEGAADRFAVDLLNRLPGVPRGCRALVALIERLERESATPLLSGWSSTHPSPATRLETVRGACS